MLAIVTSIGTAAVPSAGTVTLALILGSVGLPLDAIGLILAVDRILDMIRTAVNVCGDAAVSCIVGKSEDEFNKKSLILKLVFSLIYYSCRLALLTINSSILRRNDD